MILYSTDLQVEGHIIPYSVYKEGSRLFFKPLKIIENVDAPIFWVAKIDEEWKPMNIDNEKFIKQVQADILKHEVS